MSEVIVVTSGKGGVGKTTITANLSIALSKLGKKVIAIDTDIGLRNLDVVMGLENHIIYNIVDVIEGNCRLHQAIIKDRKHSNLYLLPSAQSKDKDAINPNQMVNLVEKLKTQYDYILIDCPAGIEQGFRNAIAAATTAVVVTTPEVSAIRDADRIIGLLEKDGMASIYLLVNKLRPDLVKKGDMMSSEDVSEILGSEIIGCINDDVNVVIATNRGEALVDQNTSTGKSLTHIAEKLTGEKIYMDKDERRFSLLFFRNIFSRGEIKWFLENYLKENLKQYYDLPIDEVCKHEFVLSGPHGELNTTDIAKRMLDYGYHPPTIYFPLIIPEALMIEPTESESVETLDKFIDAMKQIAKEAEENPELLKTAPHNTIIKRVDDARAVKKPILTWKNR